MAHCKPCNSGYLFRDRNHQHWSQWEDHTAYYGEDEEVAIINTGVSGKIILPTMVRTVVLTEGYLCVHS